MSLKAGPELISEVSTATKLLGSEKGWLATCAAQEIDRQWDFTAGSIRRSTRFPSPKTLRLRTASAALAFTPSPRARLHYFLLQVPPWIRRFFGAQPDLKCLLSPSALRRQPRIARLRLPLRSKQRANGWDFARSHPVGE